MRITGYYWIVIDDNWEIGFYDAKFDTWKLCGSEKCWIPEQVNEKRIFY